MERIEMKMSKDMLVVAGQIAAERDITIGQLVRDLVAKEIERRKNSRPPNRADETLVAPLRARLAEDFAAAKKLQAKEFSDSRKIETRVKILIIIFAGLLVIRFKIVQD